MDLVGQVEGRPDDLRPRARPVEDAQVFLLFDDEDAQQPGQLVPDNLLGPGQQGQRTPASGLCSWSVMRPSTIATGSSTLSALSPSRTSSSTSCAMLRELCVTLARYLPTSTSSITNSPLPFVFARLPSPNSAPKS